LIDKNLVCYRMENDVSHFEGKKVLCQICGQREATFHLKEMINGEARELHLCEICAREKGLLNESFFMPDFSLSNLMTGLSGFEVPFIEEKEERCSECGLTYEEIRKRGKIGCSSCYQTFREYIIPLLERIHGKGYHSGKAPREKRMADEKTEQVYKLRRELDKAVREERYEEAAKIRDEIRKLENLRKEKSHGPSRDS